MEEFRQVLEDCQLADLGYSGNWFTWERGNLPETNIQERLDRGVDRDDKNMAEIIDTKIHLNMEIDKDESYWEQRARINWLKLGDRNTSFFHKQASLRKKRNLIQKLQLDDERETKEIEEMKEIAQAYFVKLFSNGSHTSTDRIFSGIEACISEEDNANLKANFTKEEIRTALNEMGPTKALGEDGLPAIFYQKCWPIIGEDVANYCLQQLNKSMDVSSINKTNIVLLPKVSSPTNISQFRPISLCNVIYKVIAKAIANQLRVVLHKCIDSAQSTFVSRRLITDNVLLAYEILHILKNKKIGKRGLMAVKLDMSNAYDRVDWNFVEKVMKKMGFDRGWVDMVMKCVSSVSYSVIINEFAKATERDAISLKQILMEYEKNSEQCVNFEKSTVFFSTNTQERERMAVSQENGGIGFRNLANFNVALLAKQDWRLINYPDSLLAKVLKAKYYPKSNFAEARLGNLPSLTWRSVWAARGLLDKGMCWRVGKGDKISIWNDLWILGKEADRVPNQVINEDIKLVSYLIDANNRRWKSELIRNTFARDTAEKILQIPLAELAHEDLQVWRGELTGEFSVRNAYKLLQECRQAEEDGCHIFQQCPATTEIWNQLELNWVISPNDTNMWDWLTWIFEKGCKEQIRLFCCGLWFIWFSRNSLLYEKKLLTVAEIKHSSGRATIQFDAAYDGKTLKSATGLLVRDKRGDILASKAVIHSNIATPFTAEAYAGLQATKLGVLMQLNKIVILGDLKTVIKKCQSRTIDESVIGAIIRDIYNHSRRYQEIEFAFIPKTENHYAHTIAEIALKGMEGCCSLLAVSWNSQYKTLMIHFGSGKTHQDQSNESCERGLKEKDRKEERADEVWRWKGRSLALERTSKKQGKLD
ncbi:reverse transcriptase [Gossypium australe]|uniref:Reverse transcriptase n=1 Tax=Gossypium australe TaxID=47621 RepID=A0A5B6U8V5_9ROSI|nr:reverse transcriptase [Gossypium australe]